MNERIKENNRISVDTKKVFDKMQHPLMIKKLSIEGREQRGKGNKWQAPANLTLNGECWKLLSDHKQNKDVLPPTLFNLALDVLPGHLNKGKEEGTSELERNMLKLSLLQNPWFHIQKTLKTPANHRQV